MKLKNISFALLGGLLFCSAAHADQSGVSVLNELLKGELSAVETYRQALDKMSTDANAPELKKYWAEHKDAVAKLQEGVTKAGGQPVVSSGAWGTWAEAVTGAAKAMGDTTALKALKQGEEHGAKEYQELLENKNASAEVKDLVRSTLLPQQQSHIAGLTKIIEMKKS